MDGGDNAGNLQQNMICIFGCGRQFAEGRGCNGHNGANEITVDYDDAVNPHIEADLTNYPIQALAPFYNKIEKVVLENIPLDVAMNSNIWRNAIAFLKDGGILEVRTGNFNYQAVIPRLNQIARQLGINKDQERDGVYEITQFGLIISWTYFRG